MKHNQSHAVRGKRGTIQELCEWFRVVDFNRATKRFLRGWSVEDAVCKPHQPRGRKPKT